MTALGVVDEAEAALTEAERTEQYRAVALALGEEAPPGVSVEQARRALTEAQRQHRLARDAIATLEAGVAISRRSSHSPVNGCAMRSPRSCLRA